MGCEISHRNSVTTTITPRATFTMNSWIRALQSVPHLLFVEAPKLGMTYKQFALQDTDEYQDILVNLEATQTHIDFLEKDYLKGVHALPNIHSASALEALPAPSIVSTLSSVTNIPSGATVPTSKTLEPQAAKAPRKSRIPKQVVPGVTPPPDPERWLKKRERTSTHRYDGRRKGHRGAGMGIGATQGSAVPDPIPTGSAKTTSGGGGQGKKGKKGK